MSTNPEARAWVEIRAEALRANLARIRGAVGPGAGVLPMVKADAYGLGLAEAVCVLEPEDPWGFGVATVEEGARLRSLGVTRRVVVCSPTPPGELERAVERDLQLSVSSLDTLVRLTEIGRARDVRPAIHVEVDTGMGRSGFDWARAGEWLPRVREAATDAVEWVGCHTHLHSADESEASVREQWERFDSVLSSAADLPDGLLVHVLNSAGALRVPTLARALVRPGIFLYGGAVGEGQPKPEPVASVHARVVHVREATPGTTLGYGATYRAEVDERWATLAIGYADGLPRALGNRGSALLKGCRVPIIGRISMDVTVVDISDLRGVAPGDVATLLGSDGDERIDVDDLASEAGTISYEVLTGLGSRLPRVWKGV